MKTSNLIALLTGILFGVILSIITVINSNNHILNDLQYANYQTLPYKTELIRAFEDYMNATETYLDEVNGMCDISTGSDVHCNYLDARKKVDTLLNKEDIPND